MSMILCCVTKEYNMLDDDLDDILGGIAPDSEEFFSGKEKIEDDNDEPVSGDEMVLLDPNLPQVIGSNVPVEYLDLVKSVQLKYSMLPRLNYDEIYNELADLAVKSNPNPTLHVINDEIQRVQAAKERLSEIYRNVERNYHIKKRAVDVLESAWAKYSSESSADKRKSDTVLKVSGFIMDFSEVEACYKVCLHIIKNLDSNHESLSRQITVHQQLLKMNDYSRGGLPDYDFSSRNNSDKEDENDSEELDQNNELELQEESF
jgi:hypothetical protein